MTNLEAVKALVRSMGDDATMVEAIKVGVLAILEDMEPGRMVDIGLSQVRGREVKDGTDKT